MLFQAGAHIYFPDTLQWSYLDKLETRHLSPVQACLPGNKSQVISRRRWLKQSNEDRKINTLIHWSYKNHIYNPAFFFFIIILCEIITETSASKMFNAESHQSSQHHPQANNLVVTAARFSFECFTSNLHIDVGVPSFLWVQGVKSARTW